MQALKARGATVRHVTHLLESETPPTPLCFCRADWEVIEIECPPVLEGFPAPDRPEYWPGIRMCKRCVKRRG